MSATSQLTCLSLPADTDNISFQFTAYRIIPGFYPTTEKSNHTCTIGRSWTEPTSSCLQPLALANLQPLDTYLAAPQWEQAAGIECFKLLLSGLHVQWRYG